MSAEKQYIQKTEPATELFSPDIVAKLNTVFAKLQKELVLRVHTNDSDTSRRLGQYAAELVVFSPMLTVQFTSCTAQEKPFMELLYSDGTNTRIAFHGVPGGHIFTALVVSIYYLGGNLQTLDNRLEQEIEALQVPVSIKVFVSPTCTLCQDLMVACLNIVVRSDKLTLDVFDVNLYPHMKEQYSIEGVPCLVFNDCVVKCGRRDIHKLLEDLQEMQEHQACTIRTKPQDLTALAANQILSIYTVVFYVDLIYNTVTEISAYAAPHQLEEDPQTYVAKYIQFNVKQEDQARLREFLDFSKLQRQLMDGNIAEIEVIDICSGWINIKAIPVKYGLNGEITSMLICSLDINNRKLQELKLHEKLRTANKDVIRLRKDGLTAVYNRETGQTNMEMLIDRQQEGLFCLIDCDKFKRVNDTYGHQAGDAVLIQLASVMRKTLRGNDIVFRLGGDEFAFFARNAQDKETAEKIFDRLFTRVKNIDVPGMPPHSVSISAGAVLYGGGVRISFDRLYKMADEQLYLSKQVQGCKVSYAEPIG